MSAPDLSLQGVKPGSAQGNSPAQGGKLAIGERPSLCGKFGISPSGQWRELPASAQQVMPHEFIAVNPDGKPMQAANRS